MDTYEKKYKEAMERARQFFEKPYLEDSAGIVGYIFPELRESEDERIRKDIISHFAKGIEGSSFDEVREKYKIWIAWLEKQGEQKPAAKVEPKFKVGDEIKTKNEESLIITRIDRWGYWSEDLFICNFDDADKWKLVEQNPVWSEEDEKMIDNIIDYMKPMPIFFTSTNGQSGKEYTQKFVKSAISWLKSLNLSHAGSRVKSR